MKTIAFKDRLDRCHKMVRELICRRSIAIVTILAIGLSGCVKYDTGVNFSSLNHGEIVESIQLGEQLNSFSQNAVRNWIDSIESRTQAIRGKIERPSERELLITIPFNNASDLTQKIDRLFDAGAENAGENGQFTSHMQIDESNFLLAVKNHLVYDLDLRSLKIAASNPKVALAANHTLDLNFSLHAPWGVKNASDLAATVDAGGVTWHLMPGQLNHIDAFFWLPNPLGIGAIVILAIVAIGYLLKYRQFPWQIWTNQPIADRSAS